MLTREFPNTRYVALNNKSIGPIAFVSSISKIYSSVLGKICPYCTNTPPRCPFETLKAAAAEVTFTGLVPHQVNFYELQRILGLQWRAFVGRADFNNLVTHIVECIKPLTTTHTSQLITWPKLVPQF